MDYHEYESAIQRGAELSRSGDLEGAGRLFQQLAAEPGLTDMDRAYMLHNAAVSLQRVAPAEEVERLFDEGIALERKWFRSSIREAKAKWLETIGRRDEAVDIYTDLMHEEWLTAGQRRGFEEAIFKIRP